MQQPNSGLTEFQIEIAQLFFRLKSSHPFRLGSGAALLANNLSYRPTHDLDFFCDSESPVIPVVIVELCDELLRNGWSYKIIQQSHSFVRLKIEGPEILMVDIGVDALFNQPAHQTHIGPTFSVYELAARKVAALLNRAEARDFLDVFALSSQFAQEELLEAAQKFDAGLDRDNFKMALASITRFSDDELSSDSKMVNELRMYFEN